MSAAPRPKKILAISSGGGHWIQLRRVLPAFEGHDLILASVDNVDLGSVSFSRFYAIPDATRWEPSAVLRTAYSVLRLLLREKPHVVFTTGAAPGCLALVIGRILGAKTIWLDSIANVAQLSLSGRLARPFAHLWLTQWHHLATPRGPEYAGSVLCSS